MTVGSLYYFRGICSTFCIVYINITACCASSRLLTEMPVAKLTRPLHPLNSGSFVEGLRVHDH